MASKGQKFRNHTHDFKITVIEEYLSRKSGGLCQVAKKYELNHGLLAHWIKLYKTVGVPSKRRSGRPKKDGSLKSIKTYESMTLEEKLKYKEMECEILKKLQALLKANPNG